MKNLKGLFLFIPLCALTISNILAQNIPTPIDDDDQTTTYYYHDGDGDQYGDPNDKRTSIADKYFLAADLIGINDCNDDLTAINPTTEWYLDDDGDGYGSNTIIQQCTQPAGYVSNSTDCNDSDGAVHVNQTWYQDADNDGYYGTSQTACSSPGSNWSTSSGSGTDCNDSDAAVYQNRTWYQDADGDGYYGTSQTACSSPGSNWSISSGGGNDCNDGDGAVHINRTWYEDFDGDGYYGATQTSCSSPGSNWSTSSGSGSDCDDTSTSLTTSCDYSSVISGSTKVAKSLTYTYTASSPILTGKWSLSGGGTIESQSSSSATVKWTSNSGSHTLKYGFDVSDDSEDADPGELRFLGIGQASVTIYNINTPTITVTEGCDQSSITHNGSQSSVTFYWRSPGSNAYNVSTVTRSVTAEGTYYARGYHSAGVWGPIRSATVEHNDPPTWYEDFDGDGYYGDTRVQCTSPGVKWSTSQSDGTDCDDTSGTLNTTCDYSSGVSGTTKVAKSVTYSYTADAPVIGGKWSLSGGGTIESQDANSATVEWTSSSGNHTLKYGFDIADNVEGSNPGDLRFFGIGEIIATIYNINTPSITVTEGCDQSSITHNGSQSSVTFYWRSPGSSEYNVSTVTRNVSVEGAYFVRGYHSDGVWGPIRQASVEHNDPPTWYEDFDDDGYYGDTIVQCTSPGDKWSTSVGNGSDCDDTSETLNVICDFSSDVSGPTKVAKTVTYTYTADTPVSNGKWSLSSGGTIESQDANSATVEWTASSGNHTLKYGFDVADNVEGSNPGDLRFLGIGQIISTIYNINKPVIMVTAGCDESDIEHNGSQSNVTFYWRSPGSTEYNISTNPRTINTEGNYYVRGYHSDGVWGPIRQAYVEHNDPPTWYEDFDEDGYYGETSVQCDSPGSKWSTSTGDGADCDDQDEEKFTWAHCNPATIAPLSIQYLERGISHDLRWPDPSNGTVGYYLSINGEPLVEGNRVYGDLQPWTPLEAATNAKFRVESENDDIVYESQAFEVIDPISVTLNQNKYYPGGQIDVSWTGGYSSISYKVELFQGSAELSTYEQDVTGASAEITLADNAPIDDNFTIKVSQSTANNLNGSGFGISSEFVIFKELKVTYPDTNESFVFGENVNITWEGEDEEGLYDIHVLEDGEIAVTWENVSGTSLDPDWTVTKSETDVGANYTVQVVQGSYDDVSDNTFSIGFPAAESIDPTEGDILAVGQTVPLSWSGPVTSDYNVYLDETLLTTVTGNTYDWTLYPAQVGEGHHMRVESIDGTAVSESGTFEIAPQISVATVGPVVMLGETLFLNWAGGTSNLDYVVDLIGGSGPINLYSGPDRSFRYLIPGTWELGAGFQIRVSQNENLEGSSASFEVTECTIISSASADQNYVKTYTARTDLGPCMANADNPHLVQEAISYVDGLGRPLQAIQRNGTPDDGSGNTFDLITHFDYDEFGRQDKNFLPHPGAVNTGAYQNTAESDQQTYYTARFDAADGIQAYSQQVFEPSPLNRVTKSAAPGDTWKASGEHTVDIDYQLNDGTEGIRFLLVEGTTIEDYGTYAAGELSIVKTSDENNDIVESDIYKEGIVFTYTNRKGQVVLKRTRLNVAEYAATIYIYDDYGNLRHVIQPEGVRLIEDTSNSINWTNSLNDENFRRNWMFSYEFDSRQRMVAKRVPGADWVRMVYDERDRLVLTQDGNQNLEEFTTADIILDGSQDPLDPFYEVHGATIKLTGDFHVTAGSGTTFKAKANPGIADGGWLFTKYDELNRPVLTGRMERLANPSTLAAEAVDHYTEGISHGETYTGSGDLFGYTNQSFPTEFNTGETLEEEDLLTVTYYDTYDFTGQGVPEGARDQVKGQVTGTKLRVLGTDTWLTSIIYYDDRYRVQMTVSDNLLGGKDTVRMVYRNSISPLVSMTETVHTGGEDITIVEQFTYDQMDRLLTTTHSINGATPVVIASHTYNAIGELIRKNLGGSGEEDVATVQSVDYDYNIRGWLTSINNGDNYDPEDDKFGMRLSYDDAPVGFEQYNGNIGQMLWRSQGGGLQTTAQNYVYTYDPSSRLTSADYTGDGDYDVNTITYDHNGNIKNLQRNTRDNLTYDYRTGIDQSNQLFSVTDAATTDLFEDGNTSGDDYAYDDNGNLTRDLNKDIASIAYNHLNLPQLVTFENGNTVAYTYDAGGMKLRKVVNEGSNVTTTDYQRGIHFINNSLTFLQHGEGRAVKSGSTFNYEYNLTDHLGNVRVSVNQPGTVVQRDGYYPFGLTFNGYNQSPKNNYLYNQGFGEKTFRGEEGKMFKGERQPELGVDFTKYRVYDPALGRFWQIDPLADQAAQESLTPYHYVRNNSINFTDPYGDCDWCKRTIVRLVRAVSSSVRRATINLIEKTGEATRDVVSNTQVEGKIELKGDKKLGAKVEAKGIGGGSVGISKDEQNMTIGFTMDIDDGNFTDITKPEKKTDQTLEIGGQVGGNGVAYKTTHDKNGNFVSTEGQVTTSTALPGVQTETSLKVGTKETEVSVGVASGVTTPISLPDRKGFTKHMSIGISLKLVYKKQKQD